MGTCGRPGLVAGGPSAVVRVWIAQSTGSIAFTVTCSVTRPCGQKANTETMENQERLVSTVAIQQQKPEETGAKIH